MKSRMSPDDTARLMTDYVLASGGLVGREELAVVLLKEKRLADEFKKKAADPSFRDDEPLEVAANIVDAFASYFDVRRMGDNGQFCRELIVKVRNGGIKFKARESEFAFPEEVPDEVLDHIHVEGAVKQILVNSYERNATARRVCIEEWGYQCAICGFDFGEKYGDIGDGFIHVHHLKPMSEIGKGYVVDPIRDMKPVCPNCHAMLHRNSGITMKRLATIVNERRGLSA